MFPQKTLSKLIYCLFCSLFYVKEVWWQTAKSWKYLLLQVSLTPLLFTFDPENIQKNKIRQSSTNAKANLLTFLYPGVTKT